MLNVCYFVKGNMCKSAIFSEHIKQVNSVLKIKAALVFEIADHHELYCPHVKYNNFCVKMTYNESSYNLTFTITDSDDIKVHYEHAYNKNKNFEKLYSLDDLPTLIERLQ